MLNISVIHFQPLEYFPPALNFVRFLALQPEFQVSVITTRRANQTFQAELPESLDLTMFDLSKFQTGARIGRALTYIYFTFATIRQIFAARPDVIVYFDPYSALPGIVYKLVFSRKVNLWIHFHEYFSPDWYSTGMMMARMAHFLEKRFIFEKALGISHTNAERVRLFLNDHPNVDSLKLFTFPNYPPSCWGQHHRRIDDWEGPTKFVALGSFTLKDTYLSEFCGWVEKQNGEVELDIYSLYFDEETREFLQSKNPRWIRFHPEGVPYDRIPNLFEEGGFRVGLVLYRCNHVNTIHCVSNKVFEYLVCGLDVWYSREMTGTAAYATDGIYPKVLPVDFQRLDQIQLDSAISRDGHSYTRRDFECESVYSEWATKILAGI